MPFQLLPLLLPLCGSICDPDFEADLDVGRRGCADHARPSGTPRRTRLYSLCFYVPESHVEEVKQAVFEAGAGRIGDYRCCAWQVRGAGQFRPVEGSTPFVGEQDRLERVDEFRVEMVCEDESIEKVIRKLRDVHPYEEPAFHYWRVNETMPGAVRD